MTPWTSPRALRNAVFSLLLGAAVSVPAANASQPCTVTSRLAEGDNTFVIELPAARAADHVTFINDNAAACGRLRISVADQKLPAVSAHWVPVDGSIGFTHKRLFNVSLVGVNAKFVRLNFTVERDVIAASAPAPAAHIPADFATVDAISVYDFRPQRNGLFLAPSIADIVKAESTFAMADMSLASLAAGR